MRSPCGRLLHLRTGTETPRRAHAPGRERGDFLSLPEALVFCPKTAGDKWSSAADLQDGNLGWCPIQKITLHGCPVPVSLEIDRADSR